MVWQKKELICVRFWLMAVQVLRSVAANFLGFAIVMVLV